jgi:hypothetical protein
MISEAMGKGLRGNQALELVFRNPRLKTLLPRSQGSTNEFLHSLTQRWTGAGEVLNSGIEER